MGKKIIFMAKKEFIYRVAFDHPTVKGDSRTVFYFGSLSAVFDMFSPSQLGVALKTLWKKKVCDGVPYSGSGIIITREPIYRKAKASKRGAQGLESIDGVQSCHSDDKSPQIENSQESPKNEIYE